MKTLNEINAIKEATLKQMTAKTRVTIGLDSSGLAAGSQPVFDAMVAANKAAGSPADVIPVGSLGMCKLEPMVQVIAANTAIEDAVTYVKVNAEMAERIYKEHVLGGQPIIEYTIGYAENVDQTKGIAPLREIPFFKKQIRIALRNCGIINPENIDEYIARDGYQAMAKVLNTMSADDVVNELVASGLRGRGGGGFPTGNKWKFAKASVNDKKYVCCNADEGDPGAFMDRSVLEGDPHSVLEAMAIGGYTIGADQGFIYVRAEYPVAVKRLQIAIEQAKAYGLLGKNILGTGFNFDLEIRLGAGAFVCGEETALMTSIEGKRGEPRPRPPFPAVKGLFGKPTVLNNVETYANIAQILLNGSNWFASMGTEKSKGTKVFALGGKIVNAGLVEIPMGTSLRTVIEEIGGGIPNGKQYKAAQTGGPSGGCIPPEHLDIAIDYDNLIAIGSMMGSGGLIVMDEDNCMVDIAKFFLEFTQDESCGKCTPCRIGTKRLLEYLGKISDGKATLQDLADMEKLCYYIKDNALCGLGQTAPNPVLSTLRYFRKEYESHVVDQTCPAGVCKHLLKYFITEDCKGCTLCAKKCPVNAIAGTVKERHVIDQTKCIKCGVCYSTCKFKAIIKK